MAMLLLLDSKVEKSFLWKSHCFLIDTQGPELGIEDCQGPALVPTPSACFPGAPVSGAAWARCQARWQRWGKLPKRRQTGSGRRALAGGSGGSPGSHPNPALRKRSGCRRDGGTKETATVPERIKHWGFVSPARRGDLEAHIILITSRRTDVVTSTAPHADVRAKSHRHAHKIPGMCTHPLTHK